MAAARERDGGMGGPLLASVLLHGGLLAIGLVSWPWLSKPMEMGQVVPVTIVASAPVTNVRPAIEAPEEMEALTEEPVAEAPPELVAPPLEEPEPQPKPKAAAPKPKPAPARRQESSLDLDALEQSLEKTQASGKSRSSARQGRSRAETAAEARPAIGAATGLAANALSSLAADLSRRWNPNCEVEGGADVDIRVAFRLSSSGRVVGGLDASGESSSNPVVKAASDRAKRAVRQAEPFENLPPELYGERIVVRFNAREACARGWSQ